MMLTEDRKREHNNKENGGQDLHDRLGEVLGAPVTQARLQGRADVVPVASGLVSVLRCLETSTQLL